MNIELLANLSYIVSAALFIFGLKMLGSPATARRGNLFSSMGMLIAVVAGLTAEGIVSYEYIAGGMVLGAIIGCTGCETGWHDFNARDGRALQRIWRCGEPAGWLGNPLRWRH